MADEWGELHDLPEHFLQPLKAPFGLKNVVRPNFRQVFKPSISLVAPKKKVRFALTEIQDTKATTNEWDDGPAPVTLSKNGGQKNNNNEKKQDDGTECDSKQMIWEFLDIFPYTYERPKRKDWTVKPDKKSGFKISIFNEDSGARPEPDGNPKPGDWNYGCGVSNFTSHNGCFKFSAAKSENAGGGDD